MYKRIFAFIMLFLLMGNTFILHAGQDIPSRKKVGLVLGGGGAKGAAEVGVLKVLEEAGIPIDYIAGTSIGAIVGGLYAIGYNATDLDSLYRNQDWIFLLSDQVKREAKSFLSKEEKEKYWLHIPFSKERKVSLPTGYVTGQNIVNLFSKLTVGYHQVEDFSKLPIPFCCVTVDLVAGREVVLASGSLPMAMRASMSIPGVFAPVEWDNMLLVDGGALNNLPVDVVRDMGAEVIICVDLSTGWKAREELKSVSTVVDQLIGIMGQQKYRKNKTGADLYINPLLKGYTAASFQPEAIDTMMVRGEHAARAQWDKLMALKDSIYNGEPPAAPVRKPQKPPYTHAYPINHIRIEGLSKHETEWVRDKILLQEQSDICPEEIERTLSRLQGLDIFSRVEYRLENTNPYDLVFLLEPKEHRRINIGARFDTEDLASVIANINNNQQFSIRHHYAVTGRISRNPYLETEYAYGNLFGAKLGFTYRLGYHDFDLYAGKHELDAVEFLSHVLSAYYSHDIGNFRLKSGIQFEYYDYHTDLYLPNKQPNSSASGHFLNYFADLNLDTYDRRYYPTRGRQIQIRGTLHTDNGIQYDNGSPFGSIAFHAETAYRLGARFYLLPSFKGRLLLGSPIPTIYQNCVGGMFEAAYLPWQQSWESVQHTHLVERNFVGTKLALRYRVKNKFYLTALGEYGKESHEIQDILGGGDLWGCALRFSYDFILGPVSLQTNYSNLGKNVGMYINAGFCF